MNKITIEVTGIKRKQQKVKQHSFTLALGITDFDLEDVKNKAMESIKVNMKSVNMAELRVYEMPDEYTTKSPAKYKEVLLL